MLLNQVGTVLFLRDRPMLMYHFGKIPESEYPTLIAGSAPNPVRQQAFEAFTAHYRLPGRSRIPQQAAREFLAASEALRVPEWVFACAPIQEIRAAAQ